MGRHADQRRGRTQLVVIVAILVVAVAVGIWFWFSPGSQPSPQAGREVAQQFLDRLQRGESDLAWQSTTAEFKSAQGKEAFVRTVQPLSFLKEGLEFVSVQPVAIGDQTRSEFTYKASSGETVRIVIGRDEGEWKVDRWLR